MGKFCVKYFFLQKDKVMGDRRKRDDIMPTYFIRFFQTSGGLVIYVVCSLLWYFSFLIFKKKLLYVRYLKSNNAARRVLDILEANYAGNIKNNQMNPDEFFLNIDNSIMIIRNSKLKMQVATS